MAILKISSTNPKLSFCLGKNPATQLEAKAPFKKTLRKGVVYGMFSGEGEAFDREFTCWFKDHPGEMSYSEQAFEYLDSSRYAHPYIFIGIVTEMLRLGSQGAPEDEGPYKTTLQFLFKLPFRNARFFTAPAGCEVNFELVGNTDLAQATVVAPTVKQALLLLQVIAITSALSLGDIYIPLKMEVLEKYLKMLGEVDAPYLMRRKFLTQAIQDRATFKKLEDAGLISDPTKMQLRYGNNQIQRLDAIKANLVCGAHHSQLIDLGCGEGFNSFKLAENYDHILCFDKDQESIDTVTGKAKKQELSEKINAELVEVTPEWISANSIGFEGSHVILMEVLEHMSKDKAQALLNAVLATDAKSIFFSLPCGEFNQFYGMDSDQTRHLEHEWEPTREEFLAFIESLTAPEGWVGTLHQGSDIVEGVPCTHFFRFDNAKVTQ